MATHIGIGFNNDLDPETAARGAAVSAKSQLKGKKIHLTLIFSTIHYPPQKTLPAIQETLNTKTIVGCSAAGVILSESIETRGLAILTVNSDDLQFGIGSVNNINSQDVREGGLLLARSSIMDFGKHGRQAFVFFVDGFMRNHSLLIKGIQEVLGNVFPILGAGSCDDFHFKQSFQIFKGSILKNAAVGLILGGPTHGVGVAGRHGWKPLGKPRAVTRAEDNVIQEIDGHKAVRIYEEFFGREIENLHAGRLGRIAVLYPLGIYVEGSREYLLRSIVDLLPDGSIVCQGDIPQGARVHMMIGNKDSCLLAAEEAALEARRNLLGKKAQLILVIESLARLKLLGRMAIEEIQRIKRIFGEQIPVFGMYGNGEVCPLQLTEGIKKPHFQNESIVILAIS